MMRPHRVFPYLAVAVGVLALALPFAWMMSVAVGRPQDTFAVRYQWFRWPWRLQNFTDTLNERQYDPRRSWQHTIVRGGL